MMSKTAMFFSLLYGSFFCLFPAFADVPLTNEGEAACAVVLSDNASDTEKLAAAEFAAALKKVSGGAIIPIGHEPVLDKTVVRFCLTTAPRLTSDEIALAEKLLEDGHILSVKDSSVTIIARRPRGLLFATFALLKKYAGIRYLTPGEDGEYFSVLQQVSVPKQLTMINPGTQIRTLFTGRMNVNSFIKDTWLWMLRNGIVPRIQTRRFPAEQLRFIDSMDPYFTNMGHSFTPLLLWSRSLKTTAKEKEAILNEMFQENPEMFPLLDGKREPLDGQKLQPCTTSPKTIETMIQGALNYHRGEWVPGNIFTIGNNDGTAWCQCETCGAFDTACGVDHNSPADRYWRLVNQIAGAVLATYPDHQLHGWAYQNFSLPPRKIKPDLRVPVMLVFNDRCYRHRLDDPNCAVNTTFRKCFAEWSHFENVKYSWEQIDFCGQAYAPIERHFVETGAILREKYGLQGMLLISCPPDGVYKEKHKDTVVPHLWYGIWQTLYLGAEFLWDANVAKEPLLEEAGSLYYGKGWNGGMREFRTLLETTFNATPGCYGWGRGASPLGRCLDTPGAQEKLLALLATAEKAAAEDTDPRALQHLQRDRMLFERTWLAARKEYLQGFRECKSLRKTAPIIIDGHADEYDWKNADIYSDFKLFKTTTATDESPQAQTYVRFVSEPDNLYLFIEAMEPTPDEMLATDWKGQPDPPLWKDNSLEIFITHRELADDYYQLVFNHQNFCYDALKKAGVHAPDARVTLGAKSAVSIGVDRWSLEVAIPTAKLGGKCFAGNVWKVNVARTRKLSDGSKELSSLANGYFHNAGHFAPLTFMEERVGSEGTTPWKNPDMSQVKRRTLKNPGGESALCETPAYWSVSADAVLAMPPRATDNKDRCVAIKKGRIYQVYRGEEMEYDISFELKGEAAMRAEIYRYKRLDNGKLKKIGGQTIVHGSVNEHAWKTYRMNYKKEDSGEVFAVAFVVEHGEVFIDNVYVTAK
jgi:hypothetical protein